MKRKLKSWFTVNWEELEQTEDPCPRCGENLYKDGGTIVGVYRCRECPFEGSKFEGSKHPFTTLIKAGYIKVRQVYEKETWISKK